MGAVSKNKVGNVALIVGDRTKQEAAAISSTLHWPEAVDGRREQTRKD